MASKQENSKWMEGLGPEADIVVSSRIRLARNLEKYPFPHRISTEQAQEIVEKIRDALQHSNDSVVQGLMWIPLEEMSNLERKVLVERHIISPQFIRSGLKNKVILMLKDEKISIMVNEEDHLRIQCLFSGLQLEDAWELCSNVDDVLGKELDIAFTEKYGFLTACPTNVGTGMRASLMLHLPALSMTGQTGKILSSLSQYGITVRGLYGEGTESQGNMYQISNQLTLGKSEIDIIQSLKGIAQKVVERERVVRTLLYSKNRMKLVDRIWRAYGVLTQARIMSSGEAVKLLSDVRLGVDMGVIPKISNAIFNELLVYIQSSYLQRINNSELEGKELDIKRAELIRHKFANVHNCAITAVENEIEDTVNKETKEG